MNRWPNSIESIVGERLHAPAIRGGASAVAARVCFWPVVGTGFLYNARKSGDTRGGRLLRHAQLKKRGAEEVSQPALSSEALRPHLAACGYTAARLALKLPVRRAHYSIGGVLTGPGTPEHRIWPLLKRNRMASRPPRTASSSAPNLARLSPRSFRVVGLVRRRSDRSARHLTIRCRGIFRETRTISRPKRYMPRR